jgi:hypothetical protein
VPRGARRLYLGVLDGCGYYNNVGAFQVQVRVEELPSLQIEVSEVRVSWVGRPGVRYQLEVRDLEGGGPWVPSGEPFLGDGAVHTLADRVNPASRLYRIVEKAP